MWYVTTLFGAFAPGFLLAAMLAVSAQREGVAPSTASGASGQ